MFYRLTVLVLLPSALFLAPAWAAED